MKSRGKWALDMFTAVWVGLGSGRLLQIEIISWRNMYGLMAGVGVLSVQYLDGVYHLWTPCLGDKHGQFRDWIKIMTAFASCIEDTA